MTLAILSHPIDYRVAWLLENIPEGFRLRNDPKPDQTLRAVQKLTRTINNHCSYLELQAGKQAVIRDRILLGAYCLQRLIDQADTSLGCKCCSMELEAFGELAEILDLTPQQLQAKVVAEEDTLRRVAFW